MKLKLNVYNENGEVKKTCEAQTVDITFGTVRKLMKLLKIDDMENTGQLFGSINDAWDEVIKVLSQMFPDMEEEDWENVKVDELMRIALVTIRYSFVKIKSIPVDDSEKN